MQVKRFFKSFIAAVLLSNLLSTTAYAATNGYGAGLGRTDVPNVNDYSTSSWDRFEYNYEFESGVNYKEELGTPTQTDIIPRNPETEKRQARQKRRLYPAALRLFFRRI